MVGTLEEKKKVGRCWHTRNLTKYSELSEKRSDSAVKQERLRCSGVPIVEHQLQHSLLVCFSRSVVSNSLQPHEPQHARPPCPSPTLEVYPNSCPLSQWCHPTISSSVVPFSSLLQSFPASGPFQMSQLFASGGQSIGVSASTSVPPMNTQSNELAVQGTLKSLLQHHSSKASILWHSPFFIVQLSHPYMTTGKTIALTRWNFVDKVMSLIFFSFIFISWRIITLQYWSGFCHTLTWISHVFPIPIPPPTSLSTRFLWVFPVHQAQALVSCIQPGLVICFTIDNIHVSMLFFRNIPPSPSPTESKSLFCTSVSLFLFCI